MREVRQVQTIDFAELSRLSDVLDARKPYLELIGGRKVRKVSGRTRHSRLHGEFAVKLHEWAADKGVVGIEWRFWLIPAGEERTSLVPDVAYVSNERFNRLEGDAREMPPFAPDIAVEIRSPGDRASNVQRKNRALSGTRLDARHRRQPADPDDRTPRRVGDEGAPRGRPLRTCGRSRIDV